MQSERVFKRYRYVYAYCITVKEAYSRDYDECLNRAAEEKAANARLELLNHVENMEQYDVIFLVSLIGGILFRWKFTLFWKNTIFPEKRSFHFVRMGQVD